MTDFIFAKNILNNFIPRLDWFKQYRLFYITKTHYYIPVINGKIIHKNLPKDAIFSCVQFDDYNYGGRSFALTKEQISLFMSSYIKYCYPSRKKAYFHWKIIQKYLEERQNAFSNW